MRSAFLLLGLLLLSGCSGDLDTPASSTTASPSMTTDEAGNVVPADNATIPIQTGEPVEHEETLDLAQPGSFDYTWDVKNGYRAFRVTVEIAGPQDAAFYTASGFGYRLIGGTPVQTIVQSDPNPTSLSSGSPTCQPCFDAGGEDPNAMAGSWTLHLEWGPSAASARVRVEVLY